MIGKPEAVPYVSIVIPSFNSAAILEKNLPLLLDHLSREKYTFEVIVVDDGSRDRADAAAVSKKCNVSFLQNERNLGKGASVRKGMVNATGRFRIFTDVDIPFDMDHFNSFLRYLDFKEFDLVLGDRTLPGSTYFTEIPWSRKMGSDIFSFIVGNFIVGGWYDTQCGMKGFKAEVAEDIFGVGKINGFAFDVELIYIALKRNYDVKRLPVRLRSQEGSSVSVLKHGIAMLFDILRIKWYYIRSKYSGK